MKKDYSSIVKPVIALILLLSISFSFVMLYGYNRLAKELFGEQHGVRLTGAMQTMVEEGYSSFTEGVTENNITKLDNSIETLRATIGIVNGEDFAGSDIINQTRHKLTLMVSIAKEQASDNDNQAKSKNKEQMAALKKEVSLLLEEFENSRWGKVTFRHAALLEKLDSLNFVILAINLILIILVGVLWRIDRQKETARRELLELNRNLESIVCEKTERLKAANESKSLFLSNMAHDIKTPLNSIIGFASILANDESMDEKKKKQLESMLSSAYYILDIASDMTDIARIESGKIKLYREKFYIDELKTNLAALFTPLATQKNIKLDISCEINGNIGVFGDKQKLTRALSNLLSNAINFTDGGGKVKLLIASASKNRYRFEVSDSGKGIAKSNLAKIFEPFVQVETKQLGGNGLGLFIVKSYLAAMDSEISVESEIGVGTRFYFDLYLEPSDDVRQHTNIDSYKDVKYAAEPDIDSKIKDEILEYARQGRISALKQSISEIKSEALKARLSHFADLFDMDGVANEVMRFEKEKGMI